MKYFCFILPIKIAIYRLKEKKIEKLKNYLDLSNLPDLLFWPKELSIFDKKNIKPFCCITTCDKAVTFENVTALFGVFRVFWC